MPACLLSRWSFEDDETLAYMWTIEGASVVDIATRVDRSENAVRGRVSLLRIHRSPTYLHDLHSKQAAGRANPNARWTQEEESLLRKLYEEDGLTCSEVVEHISSKSPTAIRVKAKRLRLGHTDEQTALALSRASSGKRNGMFGKPGARLGVSFTEEQKEQSRARAIKGYATGGWKKRFGQDNHAFGKPGTLLGVPFPAAAKVVLSKKGKDRWRAKTPEEKQAKIEQLRKGWSAFGKENRSKIERVVEGWLLSAGVSFESQAVVDFYVVDIKVDSKVIECHGDYWHANPSRYPDPSTWGKAQRANVHRDKSKATLFANRGYEMLVLWERDIHKNPKECQARISSFLGVQVHP